MSDDAFRLSLAFVLGMDIATTLFILRHGGRESMKTTKWLMDRFGIRTTLFGTKLALYVFFMYNISIIPIWVRWLLILAGFGVVIWNIRVAVRVSR